MNRQDAQVDRAVRSVIPECLKRPEPWTLEIDDPSLAKVVRSWLEVGFKAWEDEHHREPLLLRPDLRKYVTGLELLASGSLSEPVTPPDNLPVSRDPDDTLECVEKVGVTRAAKEVGVARQSIYEAIDTGRLRASRNDRGHQVVSLADVRAISWKRG